jgi:hypothetical protein
MIRDDMAYRSPSNRRRSAFYIGKCRARLTGSMIATVFCTVAACSGKNPSPSLGANPMSVSFADQQVGMTGAPSVISISNGGSATLTISTVELSGTNAGSFAETNDCSTVAPGASCNISVTFGPLFAGALSATLMVQSNATPGKVSTPRYGPPCSMRHRRLWGFASF